MKIFKTSLLSVCALSVLSTACLKIEADMPLLQSKQKSSSKKKGNLVTNKSSSVNEQIGDEKVKLQVISRTQFQLEKIAGKIIGVNTHEALKILNDLPQSNSSAKSIANKNLQELDREESLLLGFPMGLLGEQSIFGGVITKVSDKENENLGTLKLTDLSPLHVKTMVTMPGGRPAVTLVGCASQCEESSAQKGLINFPIVGINQESGMLILDLALIGKELDLISMLDPRGGYTKLRAVSSATTTFDYSFSTLVFDIKTSMVPVNTKPEEQESAPRTEFTVRWYLKLNSTFNPAFTSRPATEGVGFFTTERSKNSRITRFSTTDFGQTVKYYIKNVPQEYKAIFAKAFDNWNVEFQKVIGRDLLSYEFVDAGDEKAEQLVAGDIRYNIVEWDLDNKAGYGGLGPSIANQFTGETLSANVLVQGPTIISLYTKWFELSKEVRKLTAEGRLAEAKGLMAEFNKEASAEMAKREAVTFSLKLGKELEMNIHAQRPELEDPIVKNHFEIVPAGITFEEYMDGYFTEILEHELGHNLGLRHNFKGNLGAIDNGERGTVSRSIMEYLGRPYRHLNSIGLYDKMAISYGYRGIAPKHLNWFCTDEDQGSSAERLKILSPECTKSDATSDPFSFWESRLTRAIDLLLETSSASAPVWTLDEVSSQVNEAITGLSAYALSAEKTASTWTNFFGKMDRPEDVKEIPTYVLNSVKKQICDPSLKDIILNKESADARDLAQKNLDALKKSVQSKVTELKVFTATDLDCQ